MYPWGFCFFKQPEDYKIPWSGLAAMSGVLLTCLVWGILLGLWGYREKIPSLHHCSFILFIIYILPAA
jgi:hypothetical protein